MRFEKGKSYKILEAPDFMVITSNERQVAGASPLVIADFPALIVYLDRFIAEREAGKSRNEAHDLALKTAGVTIIRPQ